MAWERSLIVRILPGGHLSTSEHPEPLVAHLAAVAQDYQDGVFTGVTDVVQRIGGQPPQSPADFVRAHEREFH